MANYDRNFLVPYLRDLCCTEMLVKKLEQDAQHYGSEANKYAKWANQKYEDPKRPVLADYEVENQGNEEVLGVGTIVGGIFLCLSSSILGVIVGVPLFGWGVIMLLICAAEKKTAGEIQQKKYEEALRNYEKCLARNKKNREAQPQWRMSEQKWRSQESKTKKDLQKARAIKEKLYAVNIIPSRYRTIHAAYYLYDYFESGRETDLDRVIQTMLLEEIIQRMDKLISQNQEILLNQRMQIALMENQNQAIADNHREQMRRLAQMEVNQERQMDYQRMIEVNQEVTNFFLAADYLEKHR